MRDPIDPWSCKHCGSTYNYGWADFSIHVSRSTMKMSGMNAALIGEPAIGAASQATTSVQMLVVGRSIPGTRVSTTARSDLSRADRQ